MFQRALSATGKLTIRRENELLQRWNLEKKARGDGDAAAKAVQDARAIEKGK